MMPRSDERPLKILFAYAVFKICFSLFSLEKRVFSFIFSVVCVEFFCILPAVLCNRTQHWLFSLVYFTAKREEVCSQVEFADTEDKMNNQHLYAGDPESCVGYFNCRADVSEDFYLICHRGTQFFDDRGRCDWATPDTPSCQRKFGDS